MLFRNYIVFFWALIAGASSFLFTNCDKEGDPVIPPLEIDTNLYPGNWVDYPWPVFGQNPNTNKNVLVEYFSGHQCNTCPPAGTTAKQIVQNYPGRAFVANIHASPGDGFQYLSTPGDGYYPYLQTDFTTDAGDAYVIDIPGPMNANPAGLINRITTPQGLWNYQYTTWDNNVSDIIQANDLKLNVQQHINYYPSTNGLFVHAEVEALADLNASVNVVSYFIQKEVIDAQKDGSNLVTDYAHYNVMRGTISPIYGEPIFSSTQTGQKYYVDFSFEVPNDSINIDSNIRIITYAMNSNTYEIYQVIQSDLIP